MKKSALFLLSFLFIFCLFLGCNNPNFSKKRSIKEQKVISTKPQPNSTKKTAETYSRKIKWTADTTHSSLQFRAKHSGVYDVIGWIQNFGIVMEGQRKDFTDAEVTAFADIRSVKMPNPGMAGNLQGMFDTQNYSKANFKSKTVRNISGNNFQLIGDMTIKEITRELIFDVSFNGFGYPLTDGMPGFTVDGKFSRLDFNIGEPEIIETKESRHPLIGDTIYFRANLRFYSGN